MKFQHKHWQVLSRVYWEDIVGCQRPTLMLCVVGKCSITELHPQLFVSKQLSLPPLMSCQEDMLSLKDKSRNLVFIWGKIKALRISPYHTHTSHLSHHFRFGDPYLYLFHNMTQLFCLNNRNRCMPKCTQHRKGAGCPTDFIKVLTITP